MIIDSHCHVGEFQHYSKNLLRLMTSGHRPPPWWAPEREWQQEFLATDIDRLLGHMEEFHIDKAVIFGLSIKAYGSHVPLEYVAGLVQKHPDQLVGFHSVDPIGGEDAANEAERAIKNYGLKGIKLHHAANAVALDDPRTLPVYEKVAELGVPVVLHTGFTRVPPVDFAGRMATALNKVAARYPSLVIVLAHCGWPWLEDALAMLLRYPNVYGDLAQLASFTTQDDPARFILSAYRLIMLDKLFWGTDYPFFNPHSDIRAIRNLVEYTKTIGLEPAITEGDVAGLLGGNVARLLNI